MEEQHFKSSEKVRDFVIGMSDGLTVPFALAAGLSGAVDSTAIVITEKSSFPSQGPRSVLRPQLPNVPARVLENAAGLNQPFWLLFPSTGSTPETQFSRVALELKLVPPESHDDVFTTPPLCSVVIVLNCQPPTT